MTMSDDLDELDAALRRAMAALDGEAPAGYFEALPGRTLARLDDPADDDGAVFSSQIMAAVELPGPAGKLVALPRDDRAPAAPVAPVASMETAPEAQRSGSASAAPVPSSGGAAGPVEAPGGAAASMPSAGSPGRRRSRGVRAAIAGGIGLAAIAVIYLAAGDRGTSREPPILSTGERAAPASAPAAASPSAGGGPPVTSVAAGSAASAGSAGAGSTLTASGSVTGSAATPPAGPGSGASQDSGSGAVDKPVAKFPGPLGKRPGGKSPSRGGGGKLEIEPPDGVAGTGAAGKKIKASKPRPDRASLSGDDIERAMTAVAGTARACFAGTRGTVALRVTVTPSGRIAQVTVTGPFAGTPSGACLQRAVRTATFPPWSGAPQSFDYSYLLSD